MIVAVRLALVMFALSCVQCGTDETEPLPSQEVMIGMLMDLHIAESAMNRVPIEYRDSIGLVIREKIARKYGMSVQEFEDVIARVQRKPELGSTVYDSVIERLRREKQPESETTDQPGSDF